MDNRDQLLYVVNAMTTDGLVTQGTRASASMVFTHVSGNILALVQEVLTLYALNFFRVNINMYLHVMSFLHIDMTQVLKTLPQIR